MESQALYPEVSILCALNLAKEEDNSNSETASKQKLISTRDAVL